MSERGNERSRSTRENEFELPLELNRMIDAALHEPVPEAPPQVLDGFRERVVALNAVRRPQSRREARSFMRYAPAFACVLVAVFFGAAALLRGGQKNESASYTYNTSNDSVSNAMPFEVNSELEEPENGSSDGESAPVRVQIPMEMSVEVTPPSIIEAGEDLQDAVDVTKPLPTPVQDGGSQADALDVEWYRLAAQYLIEDELPAYLQAVEGLVLHDGSVYYENVPIGVVDAELADSEQLVTVLWKPQTD